MIGKSAANNRLRRSRIALIALLLAVLVIVVVVMAAVGFRLELWGYGSSLKILRAAVGVGVVSLICSLVAIVQTWPGRGRSGLLISVIALLIVLPTLMMPLYWSYSKSRLPPIQDISTDLESPPDFWDAPTSRVYPGAEVARQQREAYPDIEPIVLDRPLQQVFDQAVALVRERGWKLVAAEIEEGRIEATVTTFWYGFKDDVVVRLSDEDDGVRVDMRSASRFGSGGDGGANANRVRAFLAAQQKQ